MDASSCSLVIQDVKLFNAAGENILNYFRSSIIFFSKKGKVERTFADMKYTIVSGHGFE